MFDRHNPNIGHVTPAPLPRPSDAVVARMQESDRQKREREFIRETSAKVLVELISRNPKAPAISAVISVDAAELLAKTLENKGYL